MVETERSELPDAQLSEAEVRAVLEKAVQIERRGATSVAELTEAASEAGISQAALLAAVAQVLEERNAAPPAAVVPAEVVPSSRRAGWLSVAGWAGAGALAGATFPGSFAALAFTLLGIGVGFRAFDHRRERNFRQYLLEATVGWGGWAASALLLSGPGHGDVVAAFAFMWSACAAGGSAIIATKRRPQLPAASPEPSVETSLAIRSPDPE